MEIKKGALCIRDIEPTDAESYFEIFSLAEVARYDDFEPIDRDGLRKDMERIAGYKEGSLNREFAVAIMPQNKMIGVLALDQKRKYCYLGYHFNPAFQGRGLAYKSVELFVNHLPNRVKEVLRVVSHPENLPSVGLAKKLGFIHLKNRKVKGNPEQVMVYAPGKRAGVWEASCCELAQV